MRDKAIALYHDQHTDARAQAATLIVGPIKPPAPQPEPICTQHDDVDPARRPYPIAATVKEMAKEPAQPAATEFQAGDVVEVIDNQSGHEHKIGEHLPITKLDRVPACYQLARREMGWVCADEIRLVSRPATISAEPKTYTSPDGRAFVADAEGWFAHDGKGLPCAAKAAVNVIQLNGTRVSGYAYRMGILWEDARGAWDIIKWRFAE